MTDRQPTRSTTVRCGPGRACVLELGEGPCVTVLASPPFEAATYLPLLETLAARFRALALEVAAPGRARTGAGDAQLIGVAAEALQALGVGRALVVGQGTSARLAVSWRPLHSRAYRRSRCRCCCTGADGSSSTRSCSPACSRPSRAGWTWAVPEGPRVPPSGWPRVG